MSRAEDAARKRRSRAMRAAGIPPRPRGAPAVPPFVLRPDQQLWLAAHWEDDAYTDEGLRDHLGISNSTLYVWKKRLALPNRPERQRRRGTAGVIAANIRRRDCGDAAAQLARCEQILAAEPPLAVRWRRCEHCHGKEDTSAPHAHRIAA